MYKSLNLSSEKIRVSFLTFENLDGDNLVERCVDGYELFFFTDGNCKCIIEGKEFTIRSRSVLAVKPLTYLCLILDKGEKVEGLSFKFPADAVSSSVLNYLNAAVGIDKDGVRYYPPSALGEGVLGAIPKFQIANRLPQKEQADYLRAIIAEVSILLSLSGYVDFEPAEDELGSRVMQYINDNIERNVSLDRLAKRFFVSKYYLCRAFKKFSGTSVHSYINHKRIMYAKQLIASGENASVAAEAVGFGDYSAFYRAYVKIVGKSPTAQ